MSAFETIQAGADRWRQLDPKMTVEKARVEIRKARPDLAQQEQAEGLRAPATQPAPMFKAGSAAEAIDAKARALLATPPWSTATGKDASKMSLQHARIQIRQQFPDLAARERDEERQAAA